MDKAKVLASGLRSQPTNVIIVRHGQTDLNDKNLIRGWHDVPLNEEGYKQAEQLGDELKDKGLDVIVTSDLQRAQETARIISEHAGIPAIPMMELRPWNVGVHTGQESAMVSPRLEAYASQAPQQPVEGGGESFDDFRHRFLSGMQQILARFQGKNIAIVTHHRGEMLLRGWEKEGMPESREVHVETFLDWEKGIEPGTQREMDKTPQVPQVAAPQQVAAVMKNNQPIQSL